MFNVTTLMCHKTLRKLSTSHGDNDQRGNPRQTRESLIHFLGPWVGSGNNTMIRLGSQENSQGKTQSQRMGSTTTMLYFRQQENQEGIYLVGHQEIGRIIQKLVYKTGNWGPLFQSRRRKNTIRNAKEWVIVKFSSDINFTELILYKWLKKLQGKVLKFLLEEWRGFLAKICALSPYQGNRS